jgi:hypothetical protein
MSNEWSFGWQVGLGIIFQALLMYMQLWYRKYILQLGLEKLEPHAKQNIIVALRTEIRRN